MDKAVARGGEAAFRRDGAAGLGSIDSVGVDLGFGGHWFTWTEGSMGRLGDLVKWFCLQRKIAVNGKRTRVKTFGSDENGLKRIRKSESYCLKLEGRIKVDSLAGEAAS